MLNSTENSSETEQCVRPKKTIYPFAAIVGNERAKLALILNAIDPSIGGVILTGPKGSGKSTLVRAASRIFPDISVVADCSQNCSPFDPTNMCDDCREKFANKGVLPSIQRNMPLVQIPIGATEDRIVGSIDVERVMRDGIRTLHSGLLSEANQGILYLDETNLIPDHIVDVILDAAASGWNIVEREGISAAHPARFILVGSMNPEEGELRPQLMDRFALHVRIENTSDPDNRIEVIKRNIEFASNPDRFNMRFEKEEQEIRQEILNARKLLSKVAMPQTILDEIGRIHYELKVDGYRPDIVTIKTARALAAYRKRMEITLEDVEVALGLALTHRTRGAGLERPPTVSEIGAALRGTKVKKLMNKLDRRGSKAIPTPPTGEKEITISPLVVSLILFPALALTAYLLFSVPSSFLESPREVVLFILACIAIALFIGGRRHQKASVPQVRLLDLARITTTQGKFSQVAVEEDDGMIRTPSMADILGERSAMLEAMKNEVVTINETSESAETLRPPRLTKEGRPRRGTQYLAGKRAKIVASSAKGRYTYYQPPKEKPWDIALAPTLRAASLFQKRRKAEGVCVVVEPEDIQAKIREYRAPFSIALVVDMSFSMASSLSNTGRAIFSLHRSVYRRRDRVSLVVFKGKDAVVLQQPTTNLDMAVDKLRKVEASDFTPMATGLLKAWRLLRLEKQRNKDVIPILIVMSDGIANVALNHPFSSASRMSYASEAQADVMDMARILKRDGVRVIVINTSHRSKEIAGDAFRKITSSREWFTPTELMLELSRITSGSYYGLKLAHDAEASISRSKLDDWFFFETND